MDKQQTDDNLAVLNQRIDELLLVLDSFHKNNELLRKENLLLKKERDKLKEKTSIVHRRVKNMISEIKSLENKA